MTRQGGNCLVLLLMIAVAAGPVAASAGPADAWPKDSYYKENPLFHYFADPKAARYTISRVGPLGMTTRQIAGTDCLFVEAGGFSEKHEAGWRPPLVVMNRQ